MAMVDVGHTRGLAPGLGRGKMITLCTLYGILESAAAAARPFGPQNLARWASHSLV